MKDGLHPTYYAQALVTCACGAKYTMGSTRKEAKIAICANCHPFFTGKQKFVDTEGRVERFQRRYKKPEPAAEGAAPAKVVAKR